MIRYALACENGHGFESWFPSSESYDDQVARGLVSCPHCGSVKVTKQVMAPSLGASRERFETPAAPVPMVAEPERRLRELLRAVRRELTESAEHVGPRFAEEARRIHYGEAEGRAIYGDASAEEARALVDEGIEVAPLPVLPDDRN